MSILAPNNMQQVPVVRIPQALLDRARLGQNKHAKTQVSARPQAQTNTPTVESTARVERGALSPIYSDWASNRSARNTHFPINATPRDHIMVLHGDRTRDQGVRYAGLRRLTDDNRADTPLPNYKAAKISIALLAEHADLLVNECRVFVTQADFHWGPKKDTSRHRCSRPYVSSISSLFVDLDIYSNSCEYSHLSQDEVITAIKDRLKTHGIPTPVIISSGRGLYLDWFLKERVAFSGPKAKSISKYKSDFRLYEQNIDRWESIQSKLIHLLHDFGADPKVKDITRVLRLVGTINEKNGERVSVRYDDGVYHQFEQLEQVTANLPEFPEFIEPTKKNDLSDRAVSEHHDAGGMNMTPAARIASNALFQTSKYKSISRWQADADKLRNFEIIALYFQDKFEKKGRVSEHSLAHRYYRLFLDLTDLVKLRKGVSRGWRTEFMLWVSTTLFHAGLIRSNELEHTTELFKFICEDEYNVYESGDLSSLLARMEEDEAYVDAFIDRKKSYKKKMKAQRKLRNTPPQAGFVKAVRYASHHCVKRKKVSKLIPVTKRFAGFGIRTYTPSVNLLLSRLQVTPEEQLHLRTLVGKGEKRRRRSAKNKSHLISDRNHQIVLARHNGQTAHALAIQFDLSLATIYRVLKNESKWLRVGQGAQSSNTVKVLTSNSNTRSVSKTSAQGIDLYSIKLEPYIFNSYSHFLLLSMKGKRTVSAVTIEEHYKNVSSYIFLPTDLYLLESLYKYLFIKTTNRYQNETCLRFNFQTKGFTVMPTLINGAVTLPDLPAYGSTSYMNQTPSLYEQVMSTEKLESLYLTDKLKRAEESREISIEDNPFGGINSSNADTYEFSSSNNLNVPDEYLEWIETGEEVRSIELELSEADNNQYVHEDLSSGSLVEPAADLSRCAPIDDGVKQVDEPSTDEANELLTIRDQFVERIKQTTELTTKDKDRSIELLESFTLDWTEKEFKVATLRLMLISDRSTREMMKDFMSNAIYFI